MRKIKENYRLALVTGASKRLGQAFALELARMGYAIALHYHQSEQEALSAASEIKALGVPVIPIQADLTNESDLVDLFSQIGECGYPLHVLVNSAAVFFSGKLDEFSRQQWDCTFDLNLKAVWQCSQRAKELFPDGKGVIINVSDSGAKKLWSKYPAYVISKNALEHLTRLQAKTYAPDVRVNAIAPGLIEKEEQMEIENWQDLIDKLPLKRTGNLEEISQALRFLIENEYINGEILTVDGGYQLI